VPGAIGIVGYDDIPAAGHGNPALTTVAQDYRLAGELLVDTLLRQLRGEPAASQVLEPRLVVRQSCGMAL